MKDIEEKIGDATATPSTRLLLEWEAATMPGPHRHRPHSTNPTCGSFKLTCLRIRTYTPGCQMAITPQSFYLWQLWEEPGLAGVTSPLT